MGIFSEIKKLFFVTTSVGKSAADKGIDLAKDAGGELVDKAGDLASAAGSKATSLGGDILDKAGDLGGNLADKTGDLRDAILHSAEGTMKMVEKNETLKKVATTAENIGEKVLSTGEDLLNKGGEAVESIGSKILGENHEHLEKAKDFTEKVGGKVLETKDNIVEKASDIMDDINTKIDETLEKAQAEEAAEAAAPPPEPFYEKMKDSKNESLLDGTDDFFSKAEKFADGDYAGVQEGMITVDDTVHEVEKEVAKAGGFTDHDGDGNELVDDAIVVVEEQASQKLTEMEGMMDEASKILESDQPNITDAAKDIADSITDQGSDIKDAISDKAGSIASAATGAIAGAASLASGAIEDVTSSEGEEE